MSSEDRRVLAVVGFAALLCGPLRAETPSAPPLGNAASFAVLGGSAVVNSGATVVTGNLGVSPGSTISGFLPGVVKLGDTYRNDALAKAAHKDAGIAYTQLGGGMCKDLSSPISSQSEPLPPDTYCVSSTALLKGALTLDAHNVPGAVWIFRITGTLTTDPNSCVLAVNGTQPGNVFWQVSGSATLGAGSALVGNLIAHDDITLNSRANAFGRLLALTGAVTLDSNKVTLCSTCNAITLDPPVLPDAAVDKLYDQTTIRASGGAEPYTFKRISGSLPSGLSLTTGGVLSGTPNESGKFQFTVAATDSQGCSGERAYTIHVSCQAIIVTNPTTKTGTSCVLFSQPFTASGAKGVTTFSLTPGSKLPVGLQVNSSSGFLEGTPLECGRFPITVDVTDENGCNVTGPTYNLVINCPPIVVMNPEISTGTAGTRFSQTFKQSGSPCPVTFSLDSGTLPRGLTLAANGELSGTPLRIGIFTITVKATDQAGTVGIGPRYRLIIVCQTIIVRNPVNVMGTLNVPFNETFTQRGAIGSATFTETGPLPAGLPPDGSPILPNGVLSGTPTQSGPFPITVTVKDANQCTGTSPIYSLVIKPCGLTLSPLTLPPATLNVPYGQATTLGFFETITAVGGTAPYTFSVPPGVLPPGLSLNANGQLSGTPTALGTFYFCITATDANGCTGVQCYTITVTALVGGSTLSGWGMLVLSILMVAAGMVVIRRDGLT